MGLLLPFAVYLGVAVLLNTRGRCGWLEALLGAFLVVHGWMLFSAEVLGAVGLLNDVGVWLAWGLPGAFLGWLAWPSRASLLVAWPQARQAVSQWPTSVRVLAVGLLLLLVLTFLQGLIYPPNNWDGMTYHLPRVLHWLQQGSLEYYPTNIYRQLYMPPGSSIACLHLMVLHGGSDLFLGMIQWTAWLHLALAGAWLMQNLRQTSLAAGLTAALALLLPAAVLQASSVQNDVLTAGFVVLFGVMLQAALAESRWWRWGACGLALGLALATKGTSWIYLGVLGPGLALPALVQRRGLARWKLGAALLSVMTLGLALNSGVFARNLGHFGTFLPDEHTAKYRVAEPSVEVTAVNALRFSALQLSVPVDAMNEAMTGGLEALLGERLNPPGSNFLEQPFKLDGAWHEDRVSNPLHYPLALVAAILVLWRKQGRPLRLWALSVLLAGLAYCLLVRWHLWSARLWMPLLALSLPLGGWLLARCWQGGAAGRWLARLLLGAMFAYAMGAALWNTNRPWLGSPQAHFTQWDRWALYYNSVPPLRELHAPALERIATVPRAPIGLLATENLLEYPLWRYERHHFPENPPRPIYHVGPRAQYERFPQSPSEPLFILTNVGRPPPGPFGRSYYRLFLNSDYFWAWVKVPPPQPVESSP